MAAPTPVVARAQPLVMPAKAQAQAVVRAQAELAAQALAVVVALLVHPELQAPAARAAACTGT